MEKNMGELKNDIDGLRATLKSSRFLPQDAMIWKI